MNEYSPSQEPHLLFHDLHRPKGHMALFRAVSLIPRVLNQTYKYSHPASATNEVPITAQF